MIDDDVKLGENVVIHNSEQVNIFGCEIGDRSFIGPFVEITRGVKIGKDCKVESHSFLCTDVTLNDNVFIGHGVMFTNDLYPRTDRHVIYLPTIIRSFASIGSNATIVAGIEIGKHAIIGAGSVVTKSVDPYTIVAGNPARVLRQFVNLEELKSYIEERQKASEV